MPEQTTPIAEDETEQKPALAKRTSRRLFYVLTPVLMLVLCGAVTLVAGIRPYEKLQTYLHIAFMDTLKIADPNDGLIIKENEIVTQIGQTTSEGTPVQPTFGEQYARLECKSIALTVPVFWGSNSTLLEKGACQTSGSVVVGETGNSVIDAHVNTFFANLHQLQPGDEITIYTNYGYFEYEVSKMVTFDKKDKTYVLPTKTEQLTLYTCVSDVLGSSDERIAAICTSKARHFYQTDPADKGDSK